MERAFYTASFRQVAHSSVRILVDELISASGRAGYPANDNQIAAWREEVEVLQPALAPLEGKAFFEFTIPRMGRRADAVLVSGAVIFVVEFKVGEDRFPNAARNQVWDYALDLKNFHETSHTVTIVPILVSTRAADSAPTGVRRGEDGVWDPLEVSAAGLPTLLSTVLSQVSGPIIDAATWEAGGYLPTPTIVEAALALYNRHSVVEISRSDAGATNISRTSTTLQSVIESSARLGRKSLCLVTGVPGSGKTLVGLNLATTNFDPKGALYSVYLSGNGPLVKVLVEALARDSSRKGEKRGERESLDSSRRKVRAFIQNVHNFRDEYFGNEKRPPEHVAIFDEAQRAWNREQTSRFMIRKRGKAGAEQSEPEFLLEALDRHPDWAVVVCLVGGGQEINTGESGMAEWLRAAEHADASWDLYLSDRIAESEYGVTSEVRSLISSGKARSTPELHLSSSVRSFRAENVSELVRAILDLDVEDAVRHRLAADRYPIVLTRHLPVAREWLRTRARGSERMGLVVSSAAERLKPLAIDVRAQIDPVHWFLDPMNDTRSCSFLEDAATEFQIQGLELDWACLAWDADLRMTESGWDYWSFVGAGWKRIRDAQRRNYLRNAYRVLLTRARQGMVIFIPEGDPQDPTRSPGFYDPTYGYLRGLGFPELD